MDQNNVPAPITIWESLKSVFLIGLACFFGSMLYHLSDAVKERNWKQRLTVLLVSGCSGSVVGPLVMVFAHEFCPEHSEMFHMAVGCAIGSMGSQGLMMIWRLFSGRVPLNAKNADDIAEVREEMTEQERKEHAANCPFECDRLDGACMNCEKKLCAGRKE